VGIILENYRTIVKNIVQSIDDGTIVSRNSHKLDGLTTIELFRLFTQEFNLVFHKAKVVTATIDDEILGIRIPSKAIHISNINFAGIGDVDIQHDLALNTSVENILYFDLNNLNIQRNNITTHNLITIDYVSYNGEIL